MSVKLSKAPYAESKADVERTALTYDQLVAMGMSEAKPIKDGMTLCDVEYEDCALSTDDGRIARRVARNERNRIYGNGMVLVLDRSLHYMHSKRQAWEFRFRVYPRVGT